MDSNLLKEAIADAKAVRQTALANAKVALEEAFSERYQAMFAEKLKEETEVGAAPEAAAPAAEENVSEQEIDELIKELEAEVGEEPSAEPQGDVGAAPAADPSAAGTPAPMTPPAAPMPSAPGVAPVPPVGGMVPPTDPTAQCLPQGAPMGAPAIPPSAPPVGGDVGAGAPPVPPMGGPEVAGAGTPPPSDVPPTGDETDEDVDLNELLESLREEVEEEEEETIDEQTKLASSGIGSGKAGGSPNKKPSSGASSSSRVESGGDKDGFPTIDQPKVVAKEATQAGRPNKAQHATKDNLSTPSFGGKGGNGGGGNSETGFPKTDQAKTTAKEPSEANRPNQAKNATKDNLSTPGGALEENISLKKQLNEAEEVIKYVKGQLNEVNLLNAKLLYTNKLFKEYNMNNEQKMRVVEMFDLSKNVREVKLTYANIAESLNFSAKDLKKVKSSPQVQSITEGLASGAVGSTKPSTQIISEGKVSTQVSRFQKLAGITMSKK